MLFFVKELSHPCIKYIKDDPVRPEIPAEFRVRDNRFISAIGGTDSPEAMVCVSLQDTVPSTVEELDQTSTDPTVAVFYTIWSYQKGAGTDLLFQTVDEIKRQYPNVNRFVTLSPKTEMARKFHIKNGAVVFRENESTVNYEYL